MDYKKEFKYFTIFDVEKEQQYLREMHKHGWKFTNVTGIGTYHFKECEPEDVVYQLDYNKDGLAHKEEYVQMFNDFGWEYLMDFFGFSYFRKPASEMNGDEEIFCDDDSRSEMMRRVYRGRILPSLAIIGALMLVTFIFNLIFFKHQALGILTATILVLYTVIIIQNTTGYNQNKHKSGE